MRSRGNTCGAAILLALALCAPGRIAFADETVTFASARYLIGSLQLRLASERGETIERKPAELSRAICRNRQAMVPSLRLCTCTAVED